MKQSLLFPIKNLFAKGWSLSYHAWLSITALTGLTALVAPAQAQTVDIAVTSVLTMGQLPAGLGRHAPQAYVTNNGGSTRTNISVSLAVSGATAFTNVQVVPSLAAGASALVKFAAYTPLTTGTNTVTVTVPADGNNTNNSQSASQQITSGTFCYAGAAEVPVSGRGISSNGQDAIVASKFTAAAPVRLTSVSNFTSNNTTNVGQPLTAVVMSAAGTILARSATTIIQTADLNTRKTYALLTPVTVSDDFLVGFLVANDQYSPIGCNAELPPRSGAFYSVDQTTYGGTPSELLAVDGSTSKLYIAAVGAAAPACSNPTNLTATNVTGTSAQLSFMPGNGNTSYLVSYAPASGGAAQTQTVTASPVTITGLQPGAAYIATVTGSCGAQTASPPAQLYFGTVPPNDQCSDPGVPTLACGQTVTGTTFGSTSTNDPTGSFNGDQIWPASGGVFYRFTGTGAAITLSMCGSSDIYDAQLFVLRGNNCNSLTIVASNDDGCGASGDATMSLLTFNSTVGQNYFIYVTGFTGAQGSFALSVSCAGLPDLVVSTPQTVPGGAYRNVTITGPATGGAGTATLTAPLNVAGTLLVQAGGTLVANCQPITGVGSFQLAAGGTLAICDAVGISQTANTGAVRVTGTRTFSNDASYIYNGVSTQVTGDALPAQVRNLTVNNDNDLTLNAGLTVKQVLRLTNGSLQTAGLPLLLPSNATGTALVYNEGTGVVNGTATMQRYITPTNAGLGYRHYATPMSNSTVADLSTSGFTPIVGNAYNAAAQPGLTTPFPNVFGYDQSRFVTATNNITGFDKGWASPSGTNTPLAVGQGYTVNIGGTQLVDFVGSLNTGPVAVAMSRGTDAQAGWQLVGNPYPSPLDWSLVAAADRPGLDAAMYVFESSSQYGGQYRSYTNGVGAGNPEVPSSQGFFVRVSAGQSAGSLTFRNSQRVTTFGTQASFRRGVADLRPQVELTLSAPNGLTDPTHVYFETGATAAPDAAFDAEKLFNSNGLSLASVAAGTELAINGLPAQLHTTTSVPLTLRVPTGAGTYSLAATKLLNLAATGTSVYLLDATTGQRVNLQQQPSYTFALTATEATGVISQRFSLQFGPQATPTANVAQLDAASVQVFPNPARGSFTLLVPRVEAATQVEVQLINSLGQLVGTRQLPLPGTGLRTDFETTALAPGVYLLQVKAGNAALISKRLLVE
ncbi:fibronectin type III domain-containing protein [Hymenobacter negativus]|uniref:Fibronectin type III domain-containing protein n=1 Tax=Hymenobacter negativus TaxID=2795026 RepID=A0ABS3QE80_9BACT|nr:fibronectin type III domain-containing protein [Hymenobacter negativus]MBO2009542.1 fibronectin type III domain-containing protein [Hymenobacter negativus]